MGKTPLFSETSIYPRLLVIFHFKPWSCWKVSAIGIDVGSHEKRFGCFFLALNKGSFPAGGIPWWRFVQIFLVKVYVGIPAPKNVTWAHLWWSPDIPWTPLWVDRGILYVTH